MLLRLISSISLLIFALLMMSGTQIDQALYRSLMLFLILFSGFYMTIFFINVIQDTSSKKAVASVTGSGKANRGNSVNGKSKNTSSRQADDKMSRESGNNGFRTRKNNGSRSEKSTNDVDGPGSKEPSDDKKDSAAGEHANTGDEASTKNNPE